MEELPHQRGGLEALYGWFVRLRWLAVIGLVLLTFAARGLGIDVPVGQVFFVAAILAGYNLVFHLLARHDSRHAGGAGVLPAEQAGAGDRGTKTASRLGGLSAEAAEVSRLRRLVNAQILLDILCVAALLHFTGGVENPFAVFFVFHIIIASIMLSRAEAFMYAGVGTGVYVIVCALDGAVPGVHRHLDGFLTSECATNWKFVIGSSVTLGMTLFVSAFFATSIVHRLRERERRILELEDKQSRFMRTAAHQLKAPISAVQSLLKVILGGYAPPEKQREMIERSVNRTEQMLELLKDLLRLAQARTERQGRDAHPISVRQVLEEMVTLCSTQATQKSLRLKAELGDGPDLVEARDEELRDIFLNLLSNAIKYTPSGGEVRVVLTEEPEWVRSDIADTGLGIPPAEQEHLFEEFFRASNVSGLEGTGLGLSIVKERVAALRGQISFESQPGRGTTFTVRLPLAGMYPHHRQEGGQKCCPGS